MRETLVAVQFQHFAVSENRVQQLVLDLYDGIFKTADVGKIRSAATATVNNIGIVWNVQRSDLSQLAAASAHQYIRQLNVLAKIQGDKGSLRDAIGLCIVFNRCCRKLATRVVSEFVAHNHSAAHIDSNYPSWIPDSFAELSGDAHKKASDSLMPTTALRGYVIKGAERRHYEQVLENDKQLLNEIFANIK